MKGERGGKWRNERQNRARAQRTGWASQTAERGGMGWTGPSPSPHPILSFLQSHATGILHPILPPCLLVISSPPSHPILPLSLPCAIRIVHLIPPHQAAMSERCQKSMLDSTIVHPILPQSQENAIALIRQRRPELQHGVSNILEKYAPRVNMPDESGFARGRPVGPA